MPDKFINLFYIGKINNKRVFFIRREILDFLQLYPYSYSNYIYEVINYSLTKYTGKNNIDEFLLEDIKTKGDIIKSETSSLHLDLRKDKNIKNIWSNFINAYKESIQLIRNKDNELIGDEFSDI